MIRKEKNQQSKEDILRAAISEFGKRGYHGASLNTAFAQADISKGKVYHYYENKDQIYLYCVEACFDALMDKLEIGQENTAAPMTLEEYFLLRWAFFEESPDFAHIFMEAVQRPPEHLKKEIKAKKEPFDRFNRSVFHTQLNALTLRKDVSETDAMAYFEIFQEVFHRQFTEQAGTDDVSMKRHEKTLKKTLDILLYGLAKEDVR